MHLTHQLLHLFDISGSQGTLDHLIKFRHSSRGELGLGMMERIDDRDDLDWHTAVGRAPGEQLTRERFGLPFGREGGAIDGSDFRSHHAMAQTAYCSTVSAWDLP